MRLKLHINLGIALMVMSLMGQTCKRGEKPVPVTEVGFENYTFNSLRIIQDKTDKEVIAIRLVFRGGVSLHPSNWNGIQSLLMQWIVTGGPRGTSPDEFKAELERAGASIATDVHSDYAAITLLCENENFKKAWPLFANLILHPAFEDEVFYALLAYNLRELQSAEKPMAFKAISSARAQFLPSHCSQPVSGTVSTLQNLTPEIVKNYFSTTLAKKCNIELFVSGFSDQEKLVQELIYNFDQLPAGDSVDVFSGMDKIIFSPTLNVKHEANETPIIHGLFAVPASASPDAPAMHVAIRIIQERIYNTFSRQYVFSKPPVIDYAQGPFGYASITAETKWGNDWAQLIMKELDRCRREGFSEAEVRNAAALLQTDHALAMSMPDEKCALIAVASLAGDWKSPLLFDSRLAHLHAGDVSEVFKQYCTAVSWTLAGDSTGLNRAAYRFPLNK